MCVSAVSAVKDEEPPGATCCAGVAGAAASAACGGGGGGDAALVDVSGSGDSALPVVVPSRLPSSPSAVVVTGGEGESTGGAAGDTAAVGVADGGVTGAAATGECGERWLGVMEGRGAPTFPTSFSQVSVAVRMSLNLAFCALLSALLLTTELTCVSSALS